MRTQDYGADPLGDGMFRMIPSGEIVTAAEKATRLKPRSKPADDIFGMSWAELERKQGGKLTL